MEHQLRITSSTFGFQGSQDSNSLYHDEWWLE